MILSSPNGFRYRDRKRAAERKFEISHLTACLTMIKFNLLEIVYDIFRRVAIIYYSIVQ